jgi:hypothetical protein
VAVKCFADVVALSLKSARQTPAPNYSKDKQKKDALTLDKTRASFLNARA